MLRARAGYPVDCRTWLDEWFEVFQKWYHGDHRGYRPLPFYARVISHEMPKGEWLTPTNYLGLEKLMNQKHIQAHFPTEDGDQWEDSFRGRRLYYLVTATDEELENPAEFIKKHGDVMEFLGV